MVHASEGQTAMMISSAIELVDYQFGFVPNSSNQVIPFATTWPRKTQLRTEQFLNHSRNDLNNGLRQMPRLSTDNYQPPPTTRSPERGQNEKLESNLKDLCSWGKSTLRLVI